ncbi:MAG TPA: type II secretion system F family protein [Candidatus Omnitrophota bacterium]|nr:type II secretion system F family protein [Candidatus Omnitrophota bacterium]HSA30220.1 type II secretion system F family protein [Candidatus Omnitrophota bacterium]
MFVLALFFFFTTCVIVGYWILPSAYRQTVALNQKRAHQLSSKLERVIPRAQIRQVVQMYLLAPLLLGGLFFVFFPQKMQVYGAVAGVVLGFIFPSIYTRFLIASNKKKFSDQLIDVLMIMSSSFRGGLSLMQSMEAVTEEMSDPANQEFSTVLGENKMGVSLEESLEHLYNRQPSSSLQQMITAILLARETGGNLPAIFQRIVEVIRQRKRIQGQIDTLTLQGKIQGVVMAALPIVFFGWVSGINPDHFKIMYDTPVGRNLLVASFLLEVVGAYMIWQISSLKDF